MSSVVGNVVPFTEFTERSRYFYEAKRRGCDPYALVIADVAALKNLVRSIVFTAPCALPEPQLIEANRLAGTPLPWDQQPDGSAS